MDGNSEPEMDYKRTQLVKSHKLIKALGRLGPFKHGCDLSKFFFKLLDSIHRKNYAKTLLS